MTLSPILTVTKTKLRNVSTLSLQKAVWQHFSTYLTNNIFFHINSKPFKPLVIQIRPYQMPERVLKSHSKSNTQQNVSILS